MMKLRMMKSAMLVIVFGFSANAQNDKAKEKEVPADTVKQAASQPATIQADSSAVPQKRCTIRLDEIDYTKIPEDW